MEFQVLKIVLWPREPSGPRVIHLYPGVVNVITGASKTGKSAVIPIIDYCLGAEKCTIPVGEIRDRCSWFGVVVRTDEGEKLFARREPGEQNSTGEMFVREGQTVEVPAAIVAGNITADAIKAQLDRLAGLPRLSLEPDELRSGFKGRVSFRDLAAFSFQPQNIVANPSVLFFKADTTEHREKLKAIFPFVLGAVTPEMLNAKHRLEQVRSELKRKEILLRRESKSAEQWVGEVNGWLLRAQELGLAAPGPLPREAAELIALLRRVALADPISVPTPEQTSGVQQALTVLRAEEREVATKLMKRRSRIGEIRRLRESAAAYGQGLNVHRDRLAIAAWLRERFEAQDPDVQVLVEHSAKRLRLLCDALDEAEGMTATAPVLREGLDQELNELEQEASILIEKQRSLRQAMALAEHNPDAAPAAPSDFAETHRFLGRLEQALRLYDGAGEQSDLAQQVEELRARERELKAVYDEHRVRDRLDRILKRLQEITSRIIPRLDGEWKQAPIKLNINELTVEVQRGDRTDFLWEVGSGANWLAYHVAITLGLQLLFLQWPRHMVPALLVYDQPSQVYFPKGKDLITRQGAEQSPDIQAVRSVFQVLGEAAQEASGRLQIIVLDHAHTDVWGGLPGVVAVEEWGDELKLVPTSWPSRAP